MHMKLLAGLGLAAALTLGSASAQEMSPETKALYEAAKAEGEVTWYVSQFTTEGAELIGASFTEHYPGIKVNVVRATAQVIYQRLNQDMQAGVPIADVYSTTDNSQYLPLKEQNLLAAYVPENASKVLPMLQNFDPDNMLQPTLFSELVIVYRSDKISEADAPTSWKDFLDPRFKGKLGFGHPGYSGLVGNWAVALNKLYGWDYFVKLKENEPQIGRSINDVGTMLDSGERLVAHAGSGGFRKKAAEGAPYKEVYPSDGTIITVSGTAIMANGPHPNAARLFENFLLDIPVQEIRVSLDWGPSVRPEVVAVGAKPASEYLAVPVTTEDLNELPALIDRWRDLFGS